MHLSPRWFRLLSILRRWFCCCWLLFIVTPIVGVCNCSMFCCMVLYVHSSIALVFMEKRELVALLYLSSWCLVMVERLFLAVLRGCLWFVIVVFPDHTHYFCPVLPRVNYVNYILLCTLFLRRSINKDTVLFYSVGECTLDNILSFW